MREADDAVNKRLQELEILQDHYDEFVKFLEAVMDHLNFSLTDIQRDIADFVEKGPDSLMVQAERGIAKTTIVGAYAAYCLIHDPDIRILIVTANKKFASQISTLIIRLIMTMDELECLRPDPGNGDRTSVEQFDVHYSLRKPAEKAPSVACVGISGSITGSRSDLLIADDIENPKNSKNAITREQLLQWSNEFSNVCEDGRIIYLGTPQSTDSIYNSLPGRGFVVRIWPGRYPTPEQRPAYGEHLAPYISTRLDKNPDLGTGGGISGDQGQPTDTRIGEETLQRKELETGTPSFQLQYMLNTSLTDRFRYPLKLEQLICLPLNGSIYPMNLNRDPRDIGLKTYQANGFSFKMSSHMDIQEADFSGSFKNPSYQPLQTKIMYIDPAAGGSTSQDETGYAVMGFLNGNLYLLAVGGVPGGYELDKMEKLAEIAALHQPNEVVIEKNMGYGAFKHVFMPILRQKYKGAVKDDFVSGQKEKRIAEVLGPIIGRGSLAVSSSCIEEDVMTAMNHSVEKRKVYSFFFQLSKLTLDRNSLKHDDRLDAVAGAANQFVELMAVDQKRAIALQTQREFDKWVKNPLGYRDNKPPSRGGGSLFNKYKR